MQQLLSNTDAFRPAELTCNAVSLYETMLLRSAHEEQHMRRPGTQVHGLETWPRLQAQWRDLRSAVKHMVRLAK